MGREIVLPWNCKTQDKIFKMLKWFWLIGGSSLLLADAFIISINPNSTQPLFYQGIFCFIFSLVWGLTWLLQFCAWWADDRLPHFSCRTKSEGSQS